MDEKPPDARRFRWSSPIFLGALSLLFVPLWTAQRILRHLLYLLTRRLDVVGLLQIPIYLALWLTLISGVVAVVMATKRLSDIRQGRATDQSRSDLRVGLVLGTVGLLLALSNIFFANLLRSVR